jgi:hypothetical protein
MAVQSLVRWGDDTTSDAHQRSESVERVVSAVKAERKLIEIGL